MTTYVFFENATTDDYLIRDQDGHKFGELPSNGYVSLKLNYSPTFTKPYTLSSANGSFGITLGISGQIEQLFPNNRVHLEVKSEEYTTRTQIFPPPIKTYDRPTICCHLYGPSHNKLLITPFNNIYARITPIIAPYVPDRVLRLDFV
jgi:hypothetical protein